MGMRIQPTADNIKLIMGFLRNQITEARTDVLIDEVLNRVPFPRYIPKFLVKKVLDSMLPEKMLDAIESTLVRFRADPVPGTTLEITESNR